jgi:hypothetical protein
MFELVPSGEVYVCTGPNRLDVVCRSNYSSFLEWNLTLPAPDSRSYTRLISTSNVVGFVSPLDVGSIEFDFEVTKNPLTSVASTSQIPSILNGTVLMCRELPDTASGNSAELVLHVVNTATAGWSVRVN